MTTREALEQTLAADRYNSPVRLVFADYLEDEGFAEEADEQRRRATPEWVEADRWMHAFCEEHNHVYIDPEYDIDLNYDRLMAMATQAARDCASNPSDSPYLSFGPNERMMDAVQENRQEFWRHWSVITGIPLPEDVEDRVAYCCGC